MLRWTHRNADSTVEACSNLSTDRSDVQFETKRLCDRYEATDGSFMDTTETTGSTPGSNPVSGSLHS